MKKFQLLFVLLLLQVSTFADIKVSDVQVFSGYPWKEVVVRYTITGSDANADFIRLTATDKTANKTYVVESGSSALTGAELSEGRHQMRWNAAAEGAKFSSTNVVFAVSAVAYGGVQLWANGPYWAECNVGATKPEEYGYYFWWGDTVGYVYMDSRWNAVDGSKSGFSFSDCPTNRKDRKTLISRGYIDATGNLVAKYDAATKHLGAPWRMPTSTEWEHLIYYCTTTWTTRSGVWGRLVTGKGTYATKSIFLPAAGFGNETQFCLGSDLNGHYWSATLYAPDVATGWHLVFRPTYFCEGGLGGDFNSWGMSVRPVRGFDQ